MPRSDRPATPAYILFYLLFSPDTWRVLIGALLAAYIGPRIAPPELNTAGRAVLFIMLTAIGWVISAKPGRWIAERLQSLVRDRRR